jgi:hypothetical protein
MEVQIATQKSRGNTTVTMLVHRRSQRACGRAPAAGIVGAEIQSSRGVLIVTHDPRMLRFANRIVHIEEERIIGEERGTARLQRFAGGGLTERALTLHQALGAIRIAIAFMENPFYQPFSKRSRSRLDRPAIGFCYSRTVPVVLPIPQPCTRLPHQSRAASCAACR